MQENNLILHVTTQAQWNLALENQQYSCESLASEGFIHCCTPAQLSGVLRRYYQGKSNLLLLEIDTAQLHNKLLYEVSPSVGESFPHVYGTINVDAVIAVQPINQ